jgi:hypothetical protein
VLQRQLKVLDIFARLKHRETRRTPTSRHAARDALCAPRLWTLTSSAPLARLLGARARLPPGARIRNDRREGRGERMTTIRCNAETAAAVGGGAIVWQIRRGARRTATSYQRRISRTP